MIVRKPPSPLPHASPDLALLVSNMLRKRPADRLTLEAALASPLLRPAASRCDAKLLARSIERETRVHGVGGDGGVLCVEGRALEGRASFRDEFGEACSDHMEFADVSASLDALRRVARPRRVGGAAPREEGAAEACTRCDGGGLASREPAGDGAAQAAGAGGDAREESVAVAPSPAPTEEAASPGKAALTPLWRSKLGVSGAGASGEDSGDTSHPAPQEVPLVPATPTPPRKLSGARSLRSYECADSRGVRGHLWVSATHVAFFAPGGSKVVMHVKRIDAVELPTTRCSRLGCGRCGVRGKEAETSLVFTLSGTPRHAETFRGFENREATLRQATPIADRPQ